MFTQRLEQEMFIAALFVISTHRKQSICPSMVEKTNSGITSYIMKYYSAIKRNEILIHTTA